MKYLKRTVSIMLILALMSSLELSIYAADQNNEEGRTFYWSPYVTSHTVTAGATKVTAQTDFYLGDIGVDIHNKYPTTKKYFTMDHCAYDSVRGIDLDASSDFTYSNLPNPHFDLDDDNHDGYYEESEVVALGPLTANIDYYFLTTYSRPSALTSGSVLITAQRSTKSISEYNTTDYDQLKSVPWSWNGKSTSAISEVNNFPKHAEPQKQFLNPDLDSISALDFYISEQQQQLSQQASSVSDGIGINTTATLTFTGPISIAELLEILKLADAELVSYEAKFIDDADTWITASASSTNELLLIANAQDIFAARGTSVSYCGITSAVVSFKFSPAYYQALQNSNLVYFVDMSNFLWQNSDNYDPSIKTCVSDYAWLVAGLS